MGKVKVTVSGTETLFDMTERNDEYVEQLAKQVRK